MSETDCTKKPMLARGGVLGGGRWRAMNVADRVIRWSTALAVVGVAAVATVVSYEHASALVRAHGESGWTGRLIPLTVDGLIYASSIVMLDLTRRGAGVPALARWLLSLGIVATLAANVTHGLGHGLIGAVVATWRAVALVGSYELLMVIIRGAHQRPRQIRCLLPSVRCTTGIHSRRPWATGCPTRTPRAGVVFISPCRTVRDVTGLQARRSPVALWRLTEADWRSPSQGDRQPSTGPGWIRSEVRSLSLNPGRPLVPFAADVLTVFGADDKLWCETIASRLRDSIPAAYADITKDAVASRLRALQVDVKSVRETGKGPRSGCERAAVAAAAPGPGALRRPQDA